MCFKELQKFLHIHYLDRVHEIQLIKLGVLSASQRSKEYDMFLANTAFEEVNEFCINQSYPFRFEAVYKCANSSAHKKNLETQVANLLYSVMGTLSQDNSPTPCLTTSTRLVKGS